MLMSWLEACAYLTAVIGGCATGIHLILKSRREAIALLTTLLARTWTNEGDVTGSEEQYINLEVENLDGDLIATLHVSSLPEPLDAHIDVSWHRARLQIKKVFKRRLYPIATVQLRMTGNNNRLKWELIATQGNVALPSRTVLWPGVPIST